MCACPNNGCLIDDGARERIVREYRSLQTERDDLLARIRAIDQTMHSMRCVHGLTARERGEHSS